MAGAGFGAAFGSMFGGGGGMKRMAQQILSNPGMVGQGNYFFPNMGAFGPVASGLRPGQGGSGMGSLPTLNGAPLFQTGGGYAFLTNQGNGVPTTSPTQGSLQEWLAQGLSPEELSMQPGVMGGFSPNNMEFMNELGFPETLPGPETAPLIQFLSEKTVAQRNQSLGRQATGVLTSGLNSLQAYRPGGAQALLSNTYGQLANSYLAQQTQAPNLLHSLEMMMYGQSMSQAKKSGRQSFYGQAAGGAFEFLGGAFGAAGNWFAKGGVVSPQRGGTKMSINGQPSVVGEAGEHEVVAPLSKVKDVAKAVAEGEKEAGGTVSGPQPYAGEGPTGGAQSPSNPEGGALSSEQPPTEGMGGGPGMAGGMGLPGPDEMESLLTFMDLQMEPGRLSTGEIMTRQLDELLVEDDLWAEAFSG